MLKKLEKLEAGKQYINSVGHIVSVRYIGGSRLFCYNTKTNTEYAISIDAALREWSELPKPKKRYWLWDIKNSDGGYVFKSSTYMDDEGRGSNGSLVFNKHSLIKKHESEFIEADA